MYPSALGKEHFMLGEYKPFTQLRAVATSILYLPVQTAGQKLPKFRFRTHITTLWAIIQSSILSAKFDCPVAHQNISTSASAHDFGNGLIYDYLLLAMIALGCS